MGELRTALAVIGLGTTAGGLLLGAGRVLSTAWTVVLKPGPASLDQLSAALASTAAAVICGWLALALFASVVSALADRAGPALAGTVRLVLVADRLSPVLLRRLIAGLLGAGLVVGAGTAASASVSHSAPASVSASAWVSASVSAFGSAERPAAASTGAAWALDPGWLPTGATPAAPTTRARAGPTGPAAQVETAALPGPRLRVPLADETVVRRGDTLWSLASRSLGPDAGAAEIAAEWPRWYAANRSVIGSNPDHLEPGQRLRPPAAADLPFGGVR
jgi:resuscitation-promoting factor RpfA